MVQYHLLFMQIFVKVDLPLSIEDTGIEVLEFMQLCRIKQLEDLANSLQYVLLRFNQLLSVSQSDD